jgi:cell wall-associated NlpC family hydrolase
VESWANTYIGLPYADHGRTRDGCDCWGLVRLVYRDRLGIELPSLADGYVAANDRASVARLIADERTDTGWHEIEHGAERPLDLVLLRIGGEPCHVGLVVEPGLMLHILKGTNATTERYARPMWIRRVESYWRWIGSVVQVASCRPSV